MATGLPGSPLRSPWRLDALRAHARERACRRPTTMTSPGFEPGLRGRGLREEADDLQALVDGRDLDAETRVLDRVVALAPAAVLVGRDEVAVLVEVVDVGVHGLVEGVGRPRSSSSSST